MLKNTPNADQKITRVSCNNTRCTCHCKKAIAKNQSHKFSSSELRVIFEARWLIGGQASNQIIVAITLLHLSLALSMLKLPSREGQLN